MSRTPRAYVVRPYPHNIHRLKDFLEQNRVALGWPGMGSLEGCTTRESIKQQVAYHYGYSTRQLGNAGGQIHRFCNEMVEGDYVLVPDGSQVYIGRVVSPYRFAPEFDTDETGWSHYHDVEWFFHKQPVDKSDLDGRVVGSLKGQSTFFESWGDSVKKFLDDHANYTPERGNNRDLMEAYLKRLQSGTARGINASSFENFVKDVLGIHFPLLQRQSTTASKVGDTDLLADCIGGIKIRVQVKFYDPLKGGVGRAAIDQLALSMDSSDTGLVVTSGVFTEDVRKYVTEIVKGEDGKSITLVNGEQLVGLLFENLDKFSGEQLRKWGVIV